MTRPVYAQAIFTGDDESQDIANGHSYTVEIRQGLFGRMITRPVRGFEYMPLNGIKPVVSRDLKEFLHHWQVKQFIVRRDP